MMFYNRNNSSSTKRKFSGIKNYFPLLEEDLKNDFSNTEFAEDLKSLVFDAHLNNADPPVETLPARFEKQTLPNNPAGNASTATVKVWELNYLLIQQQNETLRKMNAIGLTLLKERLSSDIIDVLGTYTSVRKAYQHLKNTYGETTHTQSDHDSAIWRVLALKMGESDNFNAFYEGFGKLVDFANITADKLKRMLLLSTAETNPLRLQVLPERLKSTVDKCRNQDETLKKSVELLSSAEARFQLEKDISSKGSGSNGRKSANAVRERPLDNTCTCFNCGNTCHDSQRCQTEICSYCKIFTTDHKWHNCPKRLANNGKKKRPFNGDNNRKRDRKRFDDDDDDNRSDYSQSSKSSKGGYKRSRGNDYNSSFSSKKDNSSKGGGGRGRGNSPNRKHASSPHTRRKVSFPRSSDTDDGEQVEDYMIRQAYLLGKRERSVRKLSFRHVVSKSMKLPMILDSGAEEHLVNSKQLLTEQYQTSRLPRLFAANGDEMKVKAIGKIDDDIDDVYVCPEAQDNLLSTTKLQEKGYWIILPPTDKNSTKLGEDSGYVCDKEGNVVLKIGENMMTDVSTFGNIEDPMQISLPQICEDKDYVTSKTTLNRVYGLPHGLRVEELVRFLHSIGHWTMQEMICHAQGAISNYPITEDQIKKHYPHDCAVCIKGRLKQRKINAKKIEEATIPDLEQGGKPTFKGILKKSLPQIYDIIKTEKIEPRNLTIGSQIGIDFYGPILEVSTLTATDKASGYSLGISVRKDGKKDADLAIQGICDHYKQFGHHSEEWNQPIAEIRADSDSVFVSQKAGAVFKRNGIKATFSPPNQHELNGLAESNNQHIANMVTCFFAQARHVPEQLWPLAWSFAVLVRNLKMSNIPKSNLTRLEEFTHKKPDFATTPFLPFGTVVEYFIPKASRASKFSEKSYTGIYLMPSERVANGISIYSFVTKKIVERISYRVLFHVPDAWTVISPKYFVFSGSNEELDELFEDEDINHDQNLVLGSNSKKNSNPLPSSLPLASNTLVLNTGTQQALTAPPTLHPVVEEQVPVEVAVVNSTPTPQAAVVDETTSPIEDAAIELPPNAPVTGAPSPAQEGTNLGSDDVDHDDGTHEDDDEGSDANSTRPRRSKTQYWKNWKERLSAKKNARRLFSPVVEGAILSDDHDIQNMFKKYAKECQYTIVKTNGRRVQLIDSNRQARRSTINRLHKYIRKSSKQRSKDNPTLEQAKKRKDWPKFEEAINAELKQMVDEGVYEPISYKEIENKMRIIGSMIVLQVKRTPDGKIDKYKARLVALGNQQRRDQYGNIKSPTARSSTVKMLIAIQAKTNAYSCVMDVKGAYLKSKIDPKKEVLYLRLPNGQYVKLKKYLYGLKQAGYEWNDLLANTLKANGYSQSLHDPCVFYKRYTNGDYIIMATHVDDFYVIASNNIYIEQLHTKLTKEFKEVTIKQGDILGYLGMEIKCQNGTIKLAQPGYTTKILEKSGINLAKDYADTPHSEPKYEQEGQVYVKVDKNKYLELIGMLNYLAVLTRPDILYALSRCAQRCSDPDEYDLKMVMRIFKYINNTRDYGITFKSSNDIKLVCWVDASHIHYSDGKGHFGYCFSLGEDDGCFYARSQKMKIVTPAGSTETEYVALYEATTEIVFLRSLLDEMGFPQRKPTVVFEDNKSTIAMAKGGGDFHKQKHILVKYHYTREQIKDKIVDIRFCSTEYMTADLLTKSTSRATVSRLAPRLLGDDSQTLSLRT